MADINCLLMGLSIGVHLNLLAIPAIALVYFFRKYESLMGFVPVFTHYFDDSN